MAFSVRYAEFVAFWNTHTKKWIYTETALYFHISFIFPFSSNACATYIEWKPVLDLRATYN